MILRPLKRRVAALRNIISFDATLLRGGGELRRRTCATTTTTTTMSTANVGRESSRGGLLESKTGRRQPLQDSGLTTTSSPQCPERQRQRRRPLLASGRHLCLCPSLPCFAVSAVDVVRGCLLRPSSPSSPPRMSTSSRRCPQTSPKTCPTRRPQHDTSAATWEN